VSTPPDDYGEPLPDKYAAAAWALRSPRQYCPNSGFYAISRFVGDPPRFAECDACDGRLARVVRSPSGKTWVFKHHYQSVRVVRP